MRRTNAECKVQSAKCRMPRNGNWLLLALLLVAFAPARAEDHGIIISGGDPNGDVAGWRDSLADQFESEFKRRSGDTSEVARPVSEDDIKKAIGALKDKVQCGEDVVFYFNGHGSSGGNLCLTWTDSRGRQHDESVSPDEFLKWLKEAALPCSCRIHLVIHACYSGSFVQKVAAADSHVVTAVSSASSRPAHKDVRGTRSGAVIFDGNDWPTGFDEDIDTVPADKSWQDAIQAAKGSAKTKMKDKWEDNDKPQTWKRFKNCHVEEVTLDPKSKRKTVKLKCADGSEKTVVMPANSTIRIGPVKLPYCMLNVSSYVSVLVQVTDKGEYEVKDCITSLNISGASGHVQSVDKEKGTFTMHFDNPDSLKCRTREVKMAPGHVLPDWIRYCKWVKLDSAHWDSSGINAGGVTETEPPVIEFKGHVQSADPAKGEFEVHIWEPQWLYCNTKTVRVKAGEKLPDWVKKCKWVTFRGRLTDSIVDATGVTETKPVPVDYIAHVRAVKGGMLTVHIQAPEWLLCEVKTLRPPRGQRFPDWVKPCTTVKFRAPLTGETLDVVDRGSLGLVTGSGPVNLGFNAHVESVGPGYLVVTVNEPERMKGQVRRVKIKPGQKLPEGIAFCKTITFTGNVIYDSIIGGRDVKYAATPAGKDAGALRTIAPGAEVPAYGRVVPEVEVRNFGTLPAELVPVLCRVDSAGITVYADSGVVSNLAPGVTAPVKFHEWPVGGAGTVYDLSFATGLAGDEDPSNDEVRDAVLVIPSGNRQPNLTEGRVQPGSGPPETQFMYGVVYTDPDGDMPQMHELLIDGQPFPMMPAGGEPLTGMFFTYQARLGSGLHLYRFRFDDGQGHVVETEEFTGPMVQ